MVHSEACLNKYVVSIAPFSTPVCPDCSHNINIENCSFCMFSLFNFSSIFPGDKSQLTPFAPRCGHPCIAVKDRVMVEVTVLNCLVGRVRHGLVATRRTTVGDMFNTRRYLVKL